MKNIVLTALLTSSMVVGCQSTRFSPSLPQIREYGGVRLRPTPAPLQSANPNDEPELSAVLTNEVGDQKARPEVRPGPSPRFPPPASPAMPDTVRNAAFASGEKSSVYPLTVAAKTVGVLTTAGGVGLLIAGASKGSSSESATGLLQTGLAVLLIGIALLLYRSKNGRLLAHKASSKDTTPVTSPTPATKMPKTWLKTLGWVMMFGGAALFVAIAAMGTSPALISPLFIPLAAILFGLLLLLLGS